MGKQDLLKESFVKAGKKNKLKESLLIEVYDYLIRTQYILPGEREAIQGQLERIIKKNMVKK